MQDQREDALLLRRELTRLCEGSRYRCCSGFVQHGRTSVYRHSVRVAWTSLRLARFLGWRIDAAALVRAALLHDYFLYDWHIPGRGTAGTALLIRAGRWKTPSGNLSWESRSAMRFCGTCFRSRRYRPAAGSAGWSV